MARARTRRRKSTRRRRRRSLRGLSGVSLAELKADIMRCVKGAKTKSGAIRCARYASGPGKPRYGKGLKPKRKYRYTTAKGRKQRAKRAAGRNKR